MSEENIGGEEGIIEERRKRRLISETYPMIYVEKDSDPSF